MGDSAPHSHPDVQKRRSSRIVQAVPLTVTGVDALGRPFQERTSTLIVNCHGCRYQSKHYVLKNMWVTLEVPHPEPGHDPRRVRARVMWIQRPRTVRELFQVGVELETPGNIWGIAFTPPDWFPFPETAQAELPAPSAEPGEPLLPEPSPEAWSAPGPVPVEDNVRTMPAGGAPDAGIAVARQMQRLVNEARQHLLAASRESAAQAVASETHTLIAAVERQMKDAAERTVEAAAGAAADRVIRAALERAQQASFEHLEAVRERWRAEIEAGLAEATRRMEVRLGEVENERGLAFEQKLAASLQRTLDTLQQAAGEARAGLEESRDGLAEIRQQFEDAARTAAREMEDRLGSLAERTRQELAKLEGASQRFSQQMESATVAAESAWQARLAAAAAAATERWDEQIASSIERAAQQAAERLGQSTEIARGEIEAGWRARLAAVNETLRETVAGAEARMGALRAALDTEASRAEQALERLRSAAQEAEGRAAQIRGVADTAAQELEQRATNLLEAQSRELAQRAEGSIAAWTERLRPALEQAGQETVAQLGADLEQQLSLRVERAREVLDRLDEGTRMAGEAQRAHREALERITEQAVEAAAARLQKSLERLEQAFEESGRAAAAKWLAEIEAKATETTHTTFESLFKTAEWYEKKVHTQMQTTLEKGLGQAADGLRDKAREISGVFASELDHYSRSYVEHTQEQVEEATRGALEHLRKQSAEMAAAAAASLAQQTHGQVAAALGEFRTKTSAALSEAAQRMDAQAGQFRSRLENETQRSAAEFRTALGRETHQAIGQARQELASQVEYSKDHLRIEIEGHEKRLRQAIASLSQEAVEEYRKRLDSASNSWLLTTVTRLNQQSEQQIDMLAKSAEERLRHTANQVFAGVGEALRNRLLGLLAPPAAPSSSESE